MRARRWREQAVTMNWSQGLWEGWDWPAQKAGLVCVDFILVLFRSEVCEGALTLGLNGDSQVISDPVDDILDFDR